MAIKRFWVQGGKVTLCRWQGSIIHRISGRKTTQAFPLEQTARRYVTRLGKDGQGEITELDTSDIDWMEGLEAENYDKALEIYEMGQDAYKRQVAYERSKTPEQLRADVDFIAAMQGVELA